MVLLVSPLIYLASLYVSDSKPSTSESRDQSSDHRKKHRSLDSLSDATSARHEAAPTASPKRVSRDEPTHRTSPRDHSPHGTGPSQSVLTPRKRSRSKIPASPSLLRQSSSLHSSHSQNTTQNVATNKFETVPKDNSPDRDQSQNVRPSQVGTACPPSRNVGSPRSAEPPMPVAQQIPMPVAHQSLVPGRHQGTVPEGHQNSIPGAHQRSISGVDRSASSSSHAELQTKQSAMAKRTYLNNSVAVNGRRLSKMCPRKLATVLQKVTTQRASPQCTTRTAPSTGQSR
ncbi:hypothetical protein BaRGS_00027708 [Batillaria attramentaria]|uniref:Uncharacterized protein n=1 Tax=Batillaria attramentaria TaxID=370345 RepID=A0ABD0K137_9CAEN